MPAEILLHEKLNTEITLRKGPPRERRLYGETIVYSIFIVGIVSIYSFALGADPTVRTLNRILADVSFLLLGLSLVLSSLCYFFNFADKLIIFRKHLGVVGVAYMLVHMLISFTYAGISPLLSFFLAYHSIRSFIAASGSTIIFVMMAVLSNRFSIQHIGPARWRMIMRIGYIGYALGMIHFGLRGWDKWLLWMSGNSTLFPPFSFMIFLFGIVVICLRIALFISVWRTHKKQTP